MVAQERIPSRLPLVKSLGGGVARNFQVGAVVLSSIARHALTVAAPSEGLLRVWSRVQQA
eukprot:1736197-Amphidinium_carterae.1